MKKITFLFTCLFSILVSAQQTDADERAQLILREQKSAQAILEFKANPNTQNYDILYQKLDLKVDPEKYYIKGVVEAKFKALQPMTTVVFDLSKDLKVASVKEGSNLLTFTQNQSDELVIQLKSSLGVGQERSVIITYEGAPPKNQEAFTTSVHFGTPILWTLSQPFGASDWWPCKQDLADKVDKIDVYITAPAVYKSVANGLEISQISNNDGTATTHFHHGYPIPAYLVAIAVTNYQVYLQSAGTAPHQFPIVNYIYPEYYTSVVPQLQQTVPIMNLFESWFGTYPYADEKYGHAQFGWGGGMEHSTVSFMGAFTQGLIAHELAHQWFGNKVTCGTWQDIWLNEGFSEYAAGLVVQNIQGENQFQMWKQNLVNSVTSQNGGNLYLTPIQALNSDRIFSSRITYNKGAMVVHMLRYILGDQAFFAGVKTYLSDANLAYKHAYTPDIKAHLETASGKNLTAFFDQWIYGEGYPIYDVVAEQVGKKVTLTVKQTTSSSTVDFFEMPLEIKLVGTKGATKVIVLQNTQPSQSFEVEVDFPIQSIEIDPNRNIITTSNTGTLSVESLPVKNEQISVYPNPTFTEINIDMSNEQVLTKVDLFDDKGALVGTFREKQFSIAHLSKGKYVLEIATNTGFFHKSIIKL
ncbi:M1 family aminopeptidase [Flavobacterium sp. HSC-61S13]|uniref:M1 family aminopeptidase n=1 Tax=Flavobacterium sp. HSC-61S13 TaxID=2910963 RepID=UPI0020A1B6C8|nr:M1 family aminopeptidase [Flavobacterium sp. HSC-61S13]MCP1997129.1 aminopeptidase N [Flavobacterium sp. HSC-61S13]